MKKFVLITLLLSYITIGVYAGKSDALCDKYVRLHILANSNSPFDQLTKESVKDYLLKNFENEFSSSGYGEFKTKVAECVIDELTPVRERYYDYLKNKDYLQSVYKEGAERASYIASKTIKKVYRKLGFVDKL